MGQSTVDSRLSARGLTALRLNRGNVFLKNFLLHILKRWGVMRRFQNRKFYTGCRPTCLTTTRAYDWFPARVVI